MSNITRKYGRLYRFFTFLSIFLFVAPVTHYIGTAFITSTLVTQKIALATSIVVVLILTAMCAFNKIVLRSRIWILLMALFLMLENVITPIVIIGSTQIIDELIVDPIKKHYKNKYIINKEIDKRGNK